MLSVTPSAADSRASTLNAATSPGRCALESWSAAIGSRTDIEPTATTRPHPRVRIAGSSRSRNAIGERIRDRCAASHSAPREAQRIRSPGRPAGVRDVDVDRPERGLDVLDHARHRVEIEGVEDDGMRADPVGGGADPVRVARCDGHAGALRGERGSDPEPDPLRAARDQRDAIAQPELHQAVHRHPRACQPSAPEAEEDDAERRAEPVRVEQHAEQARQAGECGAAQHGQPRQPHDTGGQQRAQRPRGRPGGPSVVLEERPRQRDGEHDRDHGERHRHEQRRAPGHRDVHGGP